MEEIYINVEYDKPVHSRSSTNQTGPRSSERRFHRAVVLCLGLLSVFLLAGLIGVSVNLHSAAAELSTIKANLTDLLQVSNKLYSLTEERDQLNSSLIKATEERDRLRQSVEKTCPAGWKMFSCSCYFLSSQSGSWTTGRDDCRNRGADLVIIDSAKEQTFLSEFTKVESWIGLNDRDKEGTWKWVDGTPLTLKYWAEQQPDNGGGDPKWGEEDCAHIRMWETSAWNDHLCKTSLPWVCEKSLSLDVQGKK